MRDLVNNLLGGVSLAPAVLSTDTNGSGVDLQGFYGALVQLLVGVGGITFDTTNKIEFQLQHSDDNSTFTAVAQTDVVGVTLGSNGIFYSAIAAHAAAAIHPVSYVGEKRYVRVVADFSGTHGTGTPISAIIVRGKPAHAPVQ